MAGQGIMPPLMNKLPSRPRNRRLKQPPLQKTDIITDGTDIITVTIPEIAKGTAKGIAKRIRKGTVRVIRTEAATGTVTGTATTIRIGIRNAISQTGLPMAATGMIDKLSVF